ncbi:hypothetical protein [Oceanobacillus bengalensis]|uniref:Uncharacterized protein n=1 Tax=Oceanobacillus bengalensis TaxID=1435466 RepID=A0A494Z4B4_9BACI|nr:hypothetical protein [Oceanobacillus bengalensis]RKQ16825.1 hypothetical protein D8M05_06115 [Oceanobacillus bengalensis]
MLFTYFFIIPSSIFGQTRNNEQTLQRQNLTIIAMDEDGAEYTYDEDGISFKVVETVEKPNDKESIIISEYYIKDKNGDYQKDSRQITTINPEKNKIEIKKINNKGKATINTQSIVDKNRIY